MKQFKTINQNKVDMEIGYKKQALIDIMKSDEELGLYDESLEIKLEEVFNDEKKKNIKKFIDEIKNPSEPNQALKDAAQRYQERMYSEEEVLEFTQTMIMQYKFGNTNIAQMDLLKETLQQFKNK